MKTVLTIITSIFMMLASVQVYAESFTCVGLDGEGNKINVLYDEDTSTVNVNGQILKVEAATQGENGVATEDFKNEDGVEVYNSLVVEDKKNIILRQYKASNDEVLATVPLACK